jgi:tetratricopeptide (TPR) repeat protein
VIARSSAFTYKGRSVDARQIGRELGVRYILEGSVRRLDEAVQVNVQLIDAATGAHVWADRFDTDRTNLVKAQRDITDRLARTLHLELVEAAGRQIEQERPVNLDARDLVMRGLAWQFRPVSEEALREAERAYERALEIDPGSLDAKAGLAMVLLHSWSAGFSKSPEQNHPRAERLAVQVLERDANHPRALLAIGWLRRLQGRFIESQTALEQAIALDPNFAGAMLQLGFTLTRLCQLEAALPHFEKALALSPRDPNQHWFYNGMGECHLYMGHLNEAIEYFTKARAVNPRIFFFSLHLAAALGLRGDIDEAKAALAESLKLKPELNSLARMRERWAAGHTPQYDALLESTWNVGIRRAGLPEE